MIKPPVDYTVNRIRKALAGLMKPEFIDVWLSTPNPSFGSRTPLSLIQDGREQELWDMIYELNSGMPE